MHEVNKIIKSNSQIYEYHDGGIIHGYVKCRSADPPAGDPWVQWKGVKMPHRLWQEILAFFVWTYEKTKPRADEAMVRLYYNDQSNLWLAWAPPQKGWGMSVKTVDDHPNWKQEEEFVGYQLLGTGHHHCSSAAFQSGTDSNDERLANGLHYTVGSLDKAYVTLHARVVFNGNMRDTLLSEWVDIADRYKPIEHEYPELVSMMAAYSLESKPPDAITFPEEWKANYLETGTITPVRHLPGPPYPSSTAHPKSDINYKRTPSDKTPAELGEEALADLEARGVTFYEIVAASKVMSSVGRENWNMNSEIMTNIQDILHKHGLNPRWLEKWVEVEQQIRTAEAYVGEYGS